MISLRMLGSVELSGDNGVPIQKVQAQPKRLALLAYLAIDPTRTFHSRDELLGIFWPDSDRDRARAALSQALYVLRKELGDDAIVARGKDEVGVNHDVIDCDTAQLQGARQAGDHKKVLDLYRGDLLQGLNLVESSAWNDWLDFERERFRNWAAEAAWVLAEAAREAGQNDRAARLGAKALKLSQDDESYVQKLLVMLDDLGDRAGAARLFRDYSERLKREYDIAVAPETQALYEKIIGRAPRRGTKSLPGAFHESPRAGEEDGRSASNGPPFLRAQSAWPKWVLAGTSFLAVTALLISWWTVSFRPGDVEQDAASEALIEVTIAPFVDRGADPGMNYVAPGIHEELYRRLSRLDRLRVLVPPQQSVGPGMAQDAPISRSNFKLEGSVSSDANGLVIELQLEGANANGEEWQHAARFPLDDMLLASASAAEWVANMLLPNLTTEDARRMRSGVTANSEAFALYLRGRFQLMSASPQAFETARDLFEQSLSLDAAFARAWSGLADAYIGLAWTRTLPDAAAIPRAREAAERSLELNPALAEAHASLAQILRRYFWDSEGAERHFREAIRLQPGNADARRRYAALLRNLGRFQEARVEVETAIELDPLNFATHQELLIQDMMEHRYEDAVQRSRQLVEVYPDTPMARFFLARSLIAAGDFDQALAEIERMPRGRDRPPALTMRGYIMGRTGQIQEAEQVIHQLQAAAERAPDMPIQFDLAVVHLGLGNYESALDALERATEEHDHRVRLLAQEPMFQALHDDPRFAGVLRTAGLLPSAQGGQAAQTMQ